ncbi:MAG: SPFH domain-containing protein [Chloroflexi bacterium]|nr:SPFH domain-containing protein [Chloroflexota bacterium]
MSTSEKSADTTPGKSPLLWFLLGGAGVFLTSLFISVLAGWPLRETFLTVAIIALACFLIGSFFRQYLIITVPEHQKIVVFRLGKVVGVKGPGPVVVRRPIETFQRVDVERVFREWGQKPCSALDGVRLEIEYAVFWQVTKDGVVASVTKTKDPGAAVKNLAEGEIAIAISKRESPDVREALGKISIEVEQQLSKYLADIGLRVVAIQIMNVTAADPEVQDAINRLAAAKMDAEALSERDKVAQKVGRAALRVLYLDALRSLGQKDSTIFMPLELIEPSLLWRSLGEEAPDRTSDVSASEDSPNTMSGNNSQQRPETEK